MAWRAHSWPCSQEKTVSRLLLEDLGRSGSDLDFSLPVVVDDGLVADRQVASKTGCTDNARILQAWYDEQDLKNKSWEQVAVRSSAVLMAILLAKFTNSDISAVELVVLIWRVGRSPRGWFNEFVKEQDGISR